MAQKDPNRYMQGDDGLIVEKVGSWAVKKLEPLTDYVFASGAARQGYERTGTALIDPFCASGRSYLRNISKFIDGSPVAAFKRSLESPGRFTSINISDADPELLDAATKRLTRLGGSCAPCTRTRKRGDAKNCC
jgi:three-Cys-motif partner protein